ncbi:hypothetical protein HJ588_12055 [Flexivirga sp. ID2601S]|uniref:Uncharacterized protein n=1 Tax=Flexivirga aerilata TaxID=1656889 RepID=A0A849AL33_9MICO|nr:hypothetical protein [Flexivirga aerilata]NNG39998.1 hypothetical protein [Flexivirga aerilata]
MPDGGNESVLYTAGIWGFLVLFGLALACWLLFRSMNKHLRGVTWREEDRRAAADATRARSVQTLRLPDEPKQGKANDAPPHTRDES